MRVIKRIVLHTVAANRPVELAELRAWHRARGWRDVGYHFYVRYDGRVEQGRPLEQVGAHVEGQNADSVGIVFEGHGDLRPLSPEQLASGLDLVRILLKNLGLSSSAVLGHRELNPGKSCPGRLVDLDAFRGAL